MKTFYIPKLINFYNYNFIKNKQFDYVCALKLVVCKVLTGAGLVRRTLRQN